MCQPVPIGVFIGDWLPYSETFIFDQLQHQQRLEAWVMARGRVTGADRFPYDQVVVLQQPERLCYQVLGWSPTYSRVLRREGVRLLHAHFGRNGVFALPFARDLDLPLVITFHGHGVSGLLPQNRFTIRYGRYQLNAPQMFDIASLLLCASQELADILVEQIGAPASKVRVHRLGIDLERFQQVERTEGPIQVLMVGRFVEKKGFEFGLRAMAELHRQIPEARLRIVGAGPLARRLLTLVEELGLNEVVTFCGVIDADGVRKEMQRADMLMAPSVVAANGDRESGVIVLKEAGACGLPTLGTQHGGIPEIIEHGKTGFLVPEREVGLLASHLVDLARDDGLRTELGKNARTRIEEQYDTVQQNRRFEDLCLSAL